MNFNFFSKEHFTKNPKQTEELGKKLAKFFLKSSFSASRAVIIGLSGELGSGKTTFLKGFAKGLGIKEKILSPTFIIMRKFSIRNSKFQTFYHFDCYRLKKASELLNLGFKKIISEPKNIICLEWLEKMRKILPQNTLIIKFDFIDLKTRKIGIKNIVRA